MIVVNGDIQEQGAGESVSAVLARLGLGEDARGVAVAIDGEVVPRTDWACTTIPEGAHVEVLTAMQGG